MAKSTHPCCYASPLAAAGRDGHCLAAGLVRRLAVDAGAALAGGVLKAFWTLSASGELWQHLAISSWRALVGFAIGGSIRLILGLISGLSRWGERLLDTSIQMLRNVPHLALIRW